MDIVFRSTCEYSRNVYFIK